MGFTKYIHFPNHKISCLYGFLIFALMMPYFLWDIKGVNTITFLIIAGLNIRYYRTTFSRTTFVTIGFLLLLLIFASRESNIFGVISNLLLITFLIIKSENILRTYKYFKTIFTLSIILSLIIYFLILLSVPLPYKIIEPLNSIKVADYRQYFFLVMQDDLPNAILPRFYGIFDEPGVVGTFAALILLIDKYNLRSFQNKVLFIAGIASFSFFFLIISLIHFIVLSRFTIKVITFILLVLLFWFTKDSSGIYDLVWHRIEIENGQLKGNNRSTSELDAYYNNFLKSPDVLWGVGKTKMDKDVLARSASYKQLIISYGIVFTVILFVTLVVMAFNIIRSVKGTFIFSLLLIALIYQRPFIFDPAYFYIIYVSMLVLSQKYYNRPQKYLLGNLYQQKR